MTMLSQHFKKCFRSPCVWAACSFMGLALPAAAQPEIYGEPTSSKFILIPPQADDWTRHFRIGALVGLGISADFKTKGTFYISGNDPAKGIYDDGYVRPDGQTASDGYTGYWGYNNASQYDAAAHTLTMHASSSFSAAGSSSESGGPFPGFELAYGDNYWYWKHARVGWELGFGLLPISISDSRPMSGSANQTTYTFDTGNMVVPGAPYKGSASGPGPIIQQQPSGQNTEQLQNQTITGSRTLNVNLYTIRLGPSFYWDISDKVGMSLGAGPAIGVVSGSYSYNEIITTDGVSSHNHGKMNATDVVYGGYVNGAVMYHINDNDKNADIFISAQYMPMSDATISGGGREGQLNLGGQVYVSAGISWPF